MQVIVFECFLRPEGQTANKKRGELITEEKINFKKINIIVKQIIASLLRLKYILLPYKSK